MIPPKEHEIDYEPPRVERVLSPDDLSRETLYAGNQNLSPPPSG